MDNKDRDFINESDINESDIIVTTNSNEDIPIKNINLTTDKKTFNLAQYDYLKYVYDRSFIHLGVDKDMTLEEKFDYYKMVYTRRFIHGPIGSGILLVLIGIILLFILRSYARSICSGIMIPLGLIYFILGICNKRKLDKKN